MVQLLREQTQTKTLIYFPIVHSQADMGALGESVRKASLKRIGRLGWKRKQDLIERFWTEVEQAINKLDLAFDRVRIYQDGLPVSDREADIVAELAGTGSRNHALVLRLVGKGAKLMGTESPELLLEEYELAKKRFASGEPGGEDQAAKSLSNSLLNRRDQFIAHRINETLCPEETGIIFLGMLHSPEQWLDKDIRVVYPLTRPQGSPQSGGR